MPTLITRKTDGLQEQTQPCNFSDVNQNEFVELDVTHEELRQRCARYKAYLAALQPPQDNTMIRAANFTTDSVLQMIQQSPGSAFIRVYYGIEENGEHRLFMAPVNDANSLTTETDLTYVDDCCRCPPLLNCPADDLMEP
ncbi:hypothetical protein H7F15_12025 [Pontibacter sp. Tf4]|uniref:hypothetical protein n=1 Tax=Pontibacter sp. Tf4 TaxID=2761620 RepID=UPI0016271F9C|nr:hypothetical protein [Pontibacter sp. Tf4]MBB6611769.1 hypothetical protein [Pontibacter sp. Tf4]